MTISEFALAAVVAPDDLAARAGQAILIEGGNALEAAVATAAVAAVTSPHLNALGGDGLWLVRPPSGRVRAIEAVGPTGAKASIRAYRDQGQDTIPRLGPLAAATVPGLVGGLIQALDVARALGGKLPLDLLLSAAIAAARTGAPVGVGEAQAPRDALLVEQPGFAAAFMRDGKPLATGTMRTAEALAATLEQLAHAGLNDFYRGDVARELAADMERLGVPVTRADLRSFQPRWREPLQVATRAGTLFAPPPPSQGIATLVGFGIAERLSIDRLDSFAFFHGLIESAKRGIVARDRAFADFDGIDVDHDGLLTPDVLRMQAEALSMERATEMPFEVSWTERSAVIAVTDMTGLTVVLAQSCGTAFGSGCVLPRTGVLLANGATAFSMEERSPFALAPGLRPRTALAPVIAMLKGGRVVSLGASGREAEAQAIVQILARLAAGATVEDACNASLCTLFRRSKDEPAFVHIDERFDGAIARRLRSAGHEVMETSEIGVTDIAALVRTGNRIETVGASAGI
ncbi:MAG TPA: gamma-glutamyltransferase [Beijerinckiaceae bacterium]|nr:gamma-glutamyltransferase [Beijerinckiaceae bacterium]